MDVSLTSDSNFFTGLAGDISRGGIFVATYDPPPVGVHVELTFELPMGTVVVPGVRALDARRSTTT